MASNAVSKARVVALVVERLMAERESLVSAARAAHEAATHAESKPEDQYDTRGLEASYLAAAQARRVEEIDRAIQVFRTGTAKDLRLVQVRCEGRIQAYLIARA